MFVVSVPFVLHEGAFICVLFYLRIPSDKYPGPCDWGKEGGGREREKYGGVEGYGCFSLGDRACCHGAGPPIGGSLVQSLNSTDCFIIEKFFPLFLSR